MDREPQTIVGRYEVIEEIAEGGMGCVYKARHRELDELRVIKTLRHGVVDDEEHNRRFEREVRILRELGHRHITRAYDSAIGDDGTAFLVLEFVDGITLDELVSRHLTPSLGLALEIACQSLEALSFIHGRGVVHRDIAADNLMLTRDPDGEPLVKLLDLGIATRVGGSSQQLTNVGSFLGKIRYTAPEQFASGGATNLDRRSDLYSFGVLFYQLLTGHCPILGSTFSEVSSHHLFKPPLAFADSDPTGRVPEQIRSLVLACLDKEVEARIPSARALLGELSPSRKAELSFCDETSYLIARIRADRGDGPPAGVKKGPGAVLMARISEVFRADQPEPPPIEEAPPFADRDEDGPSTDGGPKPPALQPPIAPVEPPAPDKPAISIPAPAAPPPIAPTRAGDRLPAFARPRGGARVTERLAALWRWWLLLAAAIALALFAIKALAAVPYSEAPQNGHPEATHGAPPIRNDPEPSETR